MNGGQTENFINLLFPIVLATADSLDNVAVDGKQVVAVRPLYSVERDGNNANGCNARNT